MDEKKYFNELENLWEQNRHEDLPKESQKDFGEILITDYLSKRAQLTPEKPCLIYYGEKITFQQMDDLSSRFAAYLDSIGMEKGDRVAVFMPNCPQFNIAFYGILKLGCIHVPVNPMFKEEELVYELQDTKAKVIVTSDYLNEMFQKIKDKTSVEKVITTSLMDYLPEEPTLPVHDMYLKPRIECSATEDMKTILEKQGTTYSDNKVTLDDTASINYTGGTTGLPKGCEHSQRNMLFSASSASTYSFFLNSEKTALVYWPSFWIAGQVTCLLNPVVTGATHILLGRWDAYAVLKAIELYKVNVISGQVDNFHELINRPDINEFDLTSIETTGVTSFSKRLNVDYRNDWKRLTGSTMRELAYGMTETHTFNTYTSFMQTDNMDLNSQPVFVGLPMPGTMLRITNFDTGEIVPLGSEGQIEINTPSLFKSYWNNSDTPSESTNEIEDNWFKTGDSGMIDEEGYLHYLGRNKELIKVNGMSVFPTEIEVFLSKHKAIETSAVVRMDDEEKGEVPVAFIKVNEDHLGKITEDEMQAWCAESFAKYKIPIIKFIDDFPTTATGKVIKTELQKNVEEMLYK